MAITSASLPAKKRILTACVRLFLEKGYKGTTVAEIIREADVSASSFQNIFRAKDGVLVELVEFMFGNQFGVARKIAGENASPVFVYAVETSIQMTLTELNDIHEHTSEELYHIFSPYLPGYTESDFYELEIGTAGIMRGYMARKCDKYFTLEKKLSRFLAMTMSAFKVPEEEQEKIIGSISGLDIRGISEQVMRELFRALAMQFEFSLNGLE